MASSAIAAAQTSRAVRDGLLVSQLDRNMVLPKRQESQHESVTWSLVGADNVCHLAGCSAGLGRSVTRPAHARPVGSEEAAAGNRPPRWGRSRGRRRATYRRVRGRIRTRCLGGARQENAVPGLPGGERPLIGAHQGAAAIDRHCSEGCANLAASGDVLVDPLAA